MARLVAGLLEHLVRLLEALEERLRLLDLGVRGRPHGHLHLLVVRHGAQHGQRPLQHPRHDVPGVQKVSGAGGQ